MKSVFHTLTSFLLLASSISAYEFDNLEAATKVDFELIKIDLKVCVKDDSSGSPVPSPGLALTSWSDGQEYFTSGSAASALGCFKLTDIPRGAVHITIEAPGYYPSITPVDLRVSTDITYVTLDDIRMTKKREGAARLIFGGDVMFDRRFFDESILHLGDTLEQETKALFRYIQPFLESGDHTNVNLECPIVEDRSTPHPSKNIVFGCHRGSAQALPHVGIDSVTIANNHLYDYLEIGTQETMDILDDVGLPWFGGGMTRQEARESLWKIDASESGANPVSLSFQGFTNYFDYAQGDNYTTFADFSPIVKGGAMPAFQSELENFVTEELRAGRIPIPVIHGGDEYLLMQDDGMRKDFETCAMAGAKLIIAHHPHVVHGISTFRQPGSADPSIVIGSLGNLVFDQDIHETFPGYLAVVDITAKGSVERLELVPFVLERYLPRPVPIHGDTTSSALARAVRRIAHMSTTESLRGFAASAACNASEGLPIWVKQTACGFGGAVPYLENGKILVVASESEVTVTDTATTHAGNGSYPRILALHEHHHDSSSLASLEAKSASPASLTCELGVDILRVGGFETETAGEHGPEDYPLPSLWSTSDHRYLQSTRTRTGTGAAVLLRTSTNQQRTSLFYDRRVGVIPGSRMTVRAFIAMENAGKFVAAVYVSTDEKVTRYERGMSFTHPGGDVADWTEFNINLDIPSDVVEIKTYFRQYPPESGEGRVFIDDVSFIQWDAELIPITTHKAVDLVTPNGWEFVRCANNMQHQQDLDVDISMTGRVYQSRKQHSSNTKPSPSRHLRQTQK